MEQHTLLFMNCMRKVFPQLAQERNTHDHFMPYLSNHFQSNQMTERRDLMLHPQLVV